MLKKIQSLLATSLIIGVLATPVLATNAYAVDVLEGPCAKNSAPTVCQDENKGSNPLYGPNGIVTSIVRILSIVIGVVAVVIIIFQAIRMITSAGDSQTVLSARNGIIYALVGVVIAALAQAIVAFVLNRVK